MERAHIIAVLALCILLAAATFITPIFNFFGFNTSDHTNLLNAISTISANILSSIFTVFIFIKFGINEIIKKLEKSYETKNLKIKMNNAFDFWNVPSKHKEWIIIYGENGKQEKLKAENPDHHCPAPSINTVKAFREIYATIKEITRDTNESIHLKHINEIETSLLDENNKQNIVLLGGVKSLSKITPTTLQESQLQINQTAEETEISITFNEKSDQESLIHQKIISKTRGTDSHPVVIQDGCIILRIKSTEESLFLFAGGYGITTYTGVSLFTKPKLTQMIKKIPSENAIGCCIKIQDDHGIHSARTPGKITCYNWSSSSKRPVDIYKNAIKRES